MIPDATRFYVDGAWQATQGRKRMAIVDPSSECRIGEVVLGDAEDVERAVDAARRAFPAFSSSTLAERMALLERINEGLVRRNDEIAATISAEMGAPRSLALRAQAPSGTQHLRALLKVLSSFAFDTCEAATVIRREPVGVAALITPWNWPMNQMATKIAPALAAGCTVVLKPSECAPLSASLLAEIIDDAGAPPGVFNLVHGTGEGVGVPLTVHSHVDMISFTGSTRAGIAISRNAARTVKRVTLELGGKSAGIVLEDADLASVVRDALIVSMNNSGQSCNALTRLLIPEKRIAEFEQALAAAASVLTIGLPSDDPDLGPIANAAQFERVRSLIQKGIDEGAMLLCGGLERPSGLDRGYFVRPTMFTRVTPGMTVAREEIFGPVLCLMTYKGLDQAVDISNDSEYGLSGYVWSADRESAIAVASRLRTGMVHINGAPIDSAAPFGGYKRSGNGRERGRYGLEEFLEYKSIYVGNEQAT